LEQLRAGRPDHVLEVEARLDQLPYCSLLRVETILVLTRLIHVEVKNFLFYDLGVFTLEGIALVENEIDAASERPNIYFLTKTAFFKD
jgi:hypothetical protein